MTGGVRLRSVLAAERGPMEVRYDNHLIRVMALTVRETAIWTYAALVMWMEDRRVRVKTFLDQPQQFRPQVMLLDEDIWAARFRVPLDADPELSPAPLFDYVDYLDPGLPD